MGRDRRLARGGSGELLLAHIPQPSADLVSQLGEQVKLIGREVVDQHGSHVVDVRSGGCFDEGAALGGDGDEGAPLIADARFAADQATLRR